MVKSILLHHNVPFSFHEETVCKRREKEIGSVKLGSSRSTPLMSLPKLDSVIIFMNEQRSGGHRTI